MSSPRQRRVIEEVSPRRSRRHVRKKEPTYKNKAALTSRTPRGKGSLAARQRAAGVFFVLSVNQTDSFFLPYSRSAVITAAVWPPRRAQREPLTPGPSENLPPPLSAVNTLPAASQSFRFFKKAAPIVLSTSGVCVCSN